MVNGKPVTDNGFRFHTTCIGAAILEMLGYAAIQTLVKTPLFGDAAILEMLGYTAIYRHL